MRSLETSAAILRMRLVGGQHSRMIEGRSRLPGNTNYLCGADPKTWHVDIPTYRQILCRSVYPGIDLVYYGNQRQLEYDFVVSPKADPSRISLQFIGAESMTVDKSGDLLIGLKTGNVRWHRPTVYQEVEGKRKPVSGQFTLRGSKRIGFAVGRYDHARSLIIDPILAYSTYLGGSSVDWPESIALDSEGNAYITGTTYSPDFPNNSWWSGQASGFVTKIDPTGSRIVYSTYIGQAYGRSIAVDAAGQAYVVGYTQGPAIPVINGAQRRFAGGLNDAFLMKINSSGTGLLYSTYLGGSNVDDARGVALGRDGMAYICGNTSSMDFPTRTPFQGSNAGGFYDIFVAKIDASKAGANSLVFSTYIGGAGKEDAAGIAIDSNNRFFIAGQTDSVDFPVRSAYKSTHSGADADAFVCGFPSDGSAPFYSTYLGGDRDDTARAIAVDSNRHVVITGGTMSANFPMRNALRNAYESFPQGDAFAAELDCGAAGDNSLIYATPIGDTTWHGQGFGIALDVWSNAYITGYTSAISPYIHAFVVKLGVSGNLLYQSIAGGSNTDRGVAIAVDPLGYAYVTGTTNSRDFPTTSGAMQTQPGGANLSPSISDSFVFRAPTSIRLDFNGDLTQDLLFQVRPGYLNGEGLMYWLMQGDQRIGGGNITLPAQDGNWRVVATADFNGDGCTDLVLQNRLTGELQCDLMEGTTVTVAGSITPKLPGPNWNVVGAADINRDGFPDLVFQNTVSGAIYFWFMRGTTMMYGKYLNPVVFGTNWRIVAVGDLNNDGHADLVFQNTSTRAVYIGYLNGISLINGGVVVPNNLDFGWEVSGLADINGDGRLEMLLDNDHNGDLAYWELNGLSVTRVGQFTPTSTGYWYWKFVGANGL